MKKRMIVMVLVFSLLASLCGVSAFAEGKDVEIKFSVGDDTLLINGESVTVAKPYVVGDGVTLVPVRVITEAFGATVGWDGETQTVTLTYPDVNIILQINNPVAEVNKRAETLLSAPELTNGYTMVPLRFISENFGAVVSYDNETRAITVTKTADGEGSMVVGMNESKYIGDSYYGWRMENPKDMQMTWRSFDGSEMEFSYDDSNWFSIMLQEKPEDYDFEESFSEWKSSFQGYYTLVKADKDTADAGKKVMHLQLKDKTDFMDMYEIETEEYIYLLDGTFSNDNKEVKEEALRILSTFETKFESTDTYDLSDVEDGMRKFEAETMKVTLSVPAEFYMISSEDAEHSFMFLSNKTDSDASIHMEIYSKDNVKSAKEQAAFDQAWNKQTLNEEVVVAFDDEIKEQTYDNFVASVYTYEYKTSDENLFVKDAFFEKGEYVYNIAIYVQLPNEEKEAYADRIINSITAEEVDFNEVGSILRNNMAPEGVTKVEDLNKCTLEMPKSFMEIMASKTSLAYTDVTGIAFVATVLTEEEYNYTKVRNELKEVETTQKKMDGVTITKTLEDVSVGKKKFLKLCFKSVEDEATSYTEVYAIAHSGMAYLFMAIYPELTYSEYARETVRTILNSVELK
ncbi:MAG: hypothetical protein E7403_01635 [Ruminococcaceae bacterium]|nr:hypothetical protein [Oscillospiraceae bacterium]